MSFVVCLLVRNGRLLILACNGVLILILFHFEVVKSFFKEMLFSEQDWGTPLKP